MDHDAFGRFLRSRRALLQPRDVGLPTGSRRRTPGLRRSEVAQTAQMSPEYLARLEQGRGATPSRELIAALARALRLDRDENDHLFVLAGYRTPHIATFDQHVAPGTLRLIDAAATLPTLVASDLNVVLAQNALAEALLGEPSTARGPARSCTYRWFTDPTFRARQPADDHDEESRRQVDDLRAAVTARGKDQCSTDLVGALLDASDEFTRLWAHHDVRRRRTDRRRLIHPAVGLIELELDVLTTVEGPRLIVYSPTPGSGALEKLQLVEVLGRQRFGATDSAGLDGAAGHGAHAGPGATR